MTFVGIICGCSDQSETELIIYLLEEKILFGKKEAIVSALDPRKFGIWKNAKVVYQEEADLDGFIKRRLFNKDCVIEDKNNWCCYGPSINYSDLYEYHLEAPRYVIENDWIRNKSVNELICHSGVVNGEWMLQVKYYGDNSDTFRSSIYSVSCWKWLLYKFRILG